MALHVYMYIGKGRHRIILKSISKWKTSKMNNTAEFYLSDRVHSTGQLSLDVPHAQHLHLAKNKSRLHNVSDGNLQWDISGYIWDFCKHFRDIRFVLNRHSRNSIQNKRRFHPSLSINCICYACVLSIRKLLSIINNDVLLIMCQYAAIVADGGNGRAAAAVMVIIIIA